ncbi:MAG TPA: hypothetical protein DD391_02215 [Clostridiales bacterium]|jgi:predicted dehydrogenase|nr:gfo/Idh/MocA family oxidoreductase [Clostridiales bacterium]HBL81408.1 hypothetical protein [Clostridiales bacterium]
MRKIKIGVFGTNIRGVNLVKSFMLLNCEIVAACEKNSDRIKYGKDSLGDIPFYSDFDEFLNSGIDAVILANYFHEHASYAIKCFKKGIHVFSECISNGTMAEGVQLAQTFKNTNSIYFLAENYPQMIFNREMQKVCKSGTLGKILYAEGEYNHPGNPQDTKFKKDYNYFEKHWRNFLPRTYYITHSLGPIMCATGATPQVVTAFAAYAPTEGDVATASYSGDKAAIITTQNDDGSIFRITGCAAFGGHHNAYRICGTEGQVENLRGMDNKIMLRYNDWTKPEGKDEINLYDAQWNDKDEDLIEKTGHGGADFITARMFIECINENRQPEHPFNLKSAIAMSSVAILANRSMLEGGKPYQIPDFDNPEDVKLYENDTLSPFYSSDGREPSIPCCSHPDLKPTEEQVELFKKLVVEIDE